MFFLICFLPAFGTIVFGAVDLATWVVITVIAAAMAMIWLIDGWRGKGYLVNTSPIQLPLVGWVLIGFFQLLPIFESTISLEPYATRLFEGRLVIFAFFFCACLTFINNEKRLRRVVWFIVIFGAGLAFFSVLQRLANPEGIYGMRRSAQAITFGPFVNQHHFAGFMAMTAGPGLALLFGGDLRRDRRILVAFSVVIMGVAVVMTSSRGGLLAFTATLAFTVIATLAFGRAKKNERVGGTTPTRLLAVGAGGIALLLLIFGSALLLGGNDALFRGTGVTAVPAGDISNGRYHIWPIAISIFLEHPFVGAGFDAFGVAFTKFDSWPGELRVEQAHNEYLQTLADAGVVGFLCLLAFLGMLFRKGFQVIRDSGAGFRRNAAVGALAGCFGIVVHSFFDFPLRTYSNGFVFLILSAIATVNIQTAVKEHREHRRRSPHATEP